MKTAPAESEPQRMEPDDDGDKNAEIDPPKTKGNKEPEPAAGKKEKKASPKAGSDAKPSFEVKPIRAMNTKEPTKETKEKESWLDGEGQLAVDVFQTENDLVIQAPIAGMKVEDLDVIIEEEVVTIKGSRKNPFLEKAAGYFIEECYWGPFSRKIILPLDADGARADASMKDGILVIRIPKILREKKRKVSIRE